MKRFLTVILAFATVLFAVSCGDEGTKDPAMGSEGGKCYGNGTCDGDLVCLSNLCVDPTETPDKDTFVNDSTTNDSTINDTEQPEVDYGIVPPGEMVDVPAGEFQMGCNEAVDDQCYQNESPYHAVTLSAYKIGKYEVTAAEYHQCIVAGACNNEGEHLYYDGESEHCRYGSSTTANFPMNCVSWYGAKAYCEWIGGRLPTEAEWEKAARGTDGWKYPWGNDPVVSCAYAEYYNYDNETGEECGCGRGDGPSEVGSVPAGISPYGAYDMIGNLWEWVNDRYGETYYETSPTNNPAGPETGDDRVLRGGGWRVSSSCSGDSLRASVRAGWPPTAIYSDAVLGFRCVIDIE